MKQFPQDSGSGLQEQSYRDYGDAAHFGALAHTGLEGVLTGCGVVSTDFTAPEVTIDGGVVRIIAESVDSRDHSNDGTADTTWPEAVQVYRVEQTTVALTDGATNEVWVQGDQTMADNASVVATTTGAPAAPSMKIGEVDTAADTTSEQWRLVAADGTLTFPDKAAASSAAGELPNGTVVYTRDEEVHWSTLAGSLKRMRVWSDPDGDGVYQLPSDADGIDVGSVTTGELSNTPNASDGLENDSSYIQTRYDVNSDTSTWHDILTVSPATSGECLVGMADGSSTAHDVAKAYWSKGGNSFSSAINKITDSSNGFDLRWDAETLQWQPDDPFADTLAVTATSQGDVVTWHINAEPDYLF